ncbi:MAG: SpoIID/LytB domain-containing protein [Candidatus Cloacimonadota bacterium]|nr:SpoIID/LytB domain-containing protein [Candidatus Cloacimonadota bacterium]
MFKIISNKITKIVDDFLLYPLTHRLCIRWISLLFFTFLAISNYAAEIMDNKFYIDVEILPNANQIHLKSNGNLIISETDSPFQLEFSKPELSIQLTEKVETSPYWRVGIKKFSDKVSAEKFLKNFSECFAEPSSEIAYKNKELKQISNYSVYLKERFNSYESAKAMCEMDGWIEEKYSFSNSEVLIYDIKNDKEYFLNAPLNITSNKPIIVFQIPKTNFWDPKQFVTRSYEGNLKIQLNQLGKMNLIANVEFERYIAGVVPNEIGDDTPMEAMKTQAIAARSEALYKIIHKQHKDDGFDLCASVHCQVFSGLTDVTKKVKRAVGETEYMVGIYNFEIINAVYSTNCGGITENSNNVWGGKSVPYLTSIYDGKNSYKINLTNESKVKQWILGKQQVFCNTENEKGWIKNSYKWKKEFLKEDLEEHLNSISDLGKLKDIKILKRGNSGRILELKIIGTKNEIHLNNELQIRQAFSGLKSSLFFVQIIGNKVIFSGKGSGHGVGMCQVGAIQMAKEGYSAKEILKHYYTGIKITKIKLSN